MDFRDLPEFTMALPEGPLTGAQRAAMNRSQVAADQARLAERMQAERGLDPIMYRLDAAKMLGDRAAYQAANREFLAGAERVNAAFPSLPSPDAPASRAVNAGPSRPQNYVGPMPTLQPPTAAPTPTVRVTRGTQSTDYAQNAQGGYDRLPTPGERFQAALEMAKVAPKPPTYRDQAFGDYMMVNRKMLADAIKADPKNAPKHVKDYLDRQLGVLQPQGIGQLGMWNDRE